MSKSKLVESPTGSTEVIATGNFGTVKVHVYVSVMLNVHEEFDIDAEVVAIARSHEAKVAWGPGVGPEDYMYGREREESWVRLGDGKCEHSKHWVIGAELEKLHNIWEQNQPEASVSALPTKGGRADG